MKMILYLLRDINKGEKTGFIFSHLPLGASEKRHFAF